MTHEAGLEPLRDPRGPAGAVRAVVATGPWGAFLPSAGAPPADARTVVADTAAPGLADAAPDALVRQVAAPSARDTPVRPICGVPERS
ncbi:hypothetical protein [Streptomyces sp. NPDC048349]|uniref:hypothetical protein n=1 Tax=Streptomyces sp. NPDC048349 TaxID=3155486 RepID=UPI00343B057D